MSARVSRVDCIIVQSEREPGLLSIRPIDEAGKVSGAAGTLRRELTRHFNKGDRVTIVRSPRATKRTREGGR